MSATYGALWRCAAEVYARTLDVMLGARRPKSQRGYRSVATNDDRRALEDRRSAYVAKLWADCGVDYD